MTPEARVTSQTDRLRTDKKPQLTRPIFIVTGARSGSTMLRYFLDSHSQIVVPGETNIAETAGAIMRSWALIGDNSTATERHEQGLRTVRRTVSALANYYCINSGKVIFCDKSLTTAANFEVVAEALPSCYFVVLYRHSMDMIVSAIEISRWGFNQFGFAPYVSAVNVVAGLAEYWCRTTELMLELERRHGRRCIRVHYENLARHSTAVLQDICRFIGVAWEEGLVAGLQRRHPEGPGDPKVDFTRGPHVASIGRGITVPVDLIPGALRERMNGLLDALGYPTVGDDWNQQIVSPLTKSAGPVSWETPDDLGSLFSRHLADLVPGGAGQLTLVAEDAAGGWVVDVERRTLRHEPVVLSSSSVLVQARSETYKHIADGSDDLALAFIRNDVRLQANGHGQRELLKQLHTLLCGSRASEAIRAITCREGDGAKSYDSKSNHLQQTSI